MVRWRPGGATPGRAQPTEPDLQNIRYLEDVLVNHDRQWEEFFSSSGVTPLTVTYEELAEDYAATIVRVHAYLDVDDLRREDVPASNLTRQADDWSTDWVARYVDPRDSLQRFTPDLAWSPETQTYVNRDGRTRAVGRVAQGQLTGDGASVPAHLQRWMANAQLASVPEDEILATLQRHDIDEQAAKEELVRMRRHPYYLGAHPIAQRMLKMESMLGVTRRLSELDGRRDVVERRPHVGRDEFLDRFYARNRPLILDDVSALMPARNWTPWSLQERCGDATVEIMSGRDADPDYEVFAGRHRTKVRMAEYIAHIEDSPESNDKYLVANNNFFQSDAGRPLLDDLRPLPPFLAPDDRGGSTFLWLGPKGTVTPFHHDVANIFFFQLFGTKQFVIGSPEEAPFLYNRQGVYADVDPEAPDLAAHPRFANAVTATVTLEAGQSLFLPVGWWHHVRALDVSLSVSTTAFEAPNRFDYYSPRRDPGN